MVFWTTHIFNYHVIPNADDNICPPLMGPIDDVSSIEKLKFLLGKS